jgi:hypothetical protein
MDFYSARLLFIVLVDDGRPRKKNMFDETVIVFRARHRTDAMKRALKIGRSHETEYKNENGNRVRWALVEVVNLDWIGRKADGQEVASHLHYRRSKRPIAFDKKFHPEASELTDTF